MAVKQQNISVLRSIWIALGVLAIVSLTRSIVDLWKRKDMVSEKKLQYEAVLKENATLKEKLTESSTSAFLEKQAREKLNLARPDDIVVLVGEASHSGKPTKQFENIHQQPSWKVWWDLFF